MLVLTRRIGEEIVLPGVHVRFILLAIRGGRIRVGVTAPTTLEVLRGELSSDGTLDLHDPNHPSPTDPNPVQPE